jgi:hypothetical protein
MADPVFSFGMDTCRTLTDKNLPIYSDSRDKVRESRISLQKKYYIAVDCTSEALFKDLIYFYFMNTKESYARISHVGQLFLISERH